jgi:hypothetical protein
MPGDLGGLAREYPNSNQSMHQTDYAVLRPLVMMLFNSILFLFRAQNIWGSVQNSDNVDLIRFDVVYNAVRFLDYFANLFHLVLRHTSTGTGSNGNLSGSTRNSVDHS